MERNYYMVRAMFSREKDFEEFFKKSVVAVGWSNVDFTQYTSVEALRDAVNAEYYQNRSKAAQVISKNLNEVERFKNIKKGDFIIVPHYSGIVLAEAEKDEIYCDDNWVYELDLSNQRKVAYRYLDKDPLIIPRNELSEGLQRRLRVRGNTVSNLYEFKDEIEKIFNRKSYSYSQVVREEEEQALKELKEGLLNNIRYGHTNLQTGGVGLEQLICELMTIEGYRSRVLAKSKFTGNADADVEAIRDDAFMSKKIFVQVKHHSGISPRGGIQQVIDVINQQEYEDFDGYFVTSADISAEDKRYADENGIKVMDGSELVDLIIADIDKLSLTTRRQLGISSVPMMLKL